jgi:hypothetical protein
LTPNSYLITVDAATYVPGLEAIFTNCTFNVSGNLLLSTDLPLKITFDSCTFNVAKTETIVKVDYSSSVEGCEADSNTHGDVKITNSII